MDERRADSLYITQESGYAVRILYCLSKEKRRMGAKEISETMVIPLRFALKIMGKLAAAGLVVSFKGNGGGYELGRPAEETTLLDAISAVEGPCLLSRCLCNDDNQQHCCNRGASGCCVFQAEFDRISKMINQELNRVTFAQLLEREQPNS